MLAHEQLLVLLVQLLEPASFLVQLLELSSFLTASPFSDSFSPFWYSCLSSASFSDSFASFSDSFASFSWLLLSLSSASFCCSSSKEP